MADTFLSTSLRQFIYLGVAPSTRQTYNSGINSYLNFCTRFNIQPYPASSLTLQFFCTDLSRHISYKSIKVYLAGMRLAHLELGHSDPTVDESLRLVIRGIRRMQGDSCRQRLPITIDLLWTLKQQIRISNYSLLEQRLLWAAFTTKQYSRMIPVTQQFGPLFSAGQFSPLSKAQVSNTPSLITASRL